MNMNDITMIYYYVEYVCLHHVTIAIKVQKIQRLVCEEHEYSSSKNNTRL